jgi:hypothetical protein
MDPLASPLMSKVAQAIGGVVVQSDVEHIISGSFGTAACLLFVCGRALPQVRALAVVFALLGGLSHLYLPTLQPHYPLEGYGSYLANSARPLTSPPQATRQQLRADLGGWFRDQEGSTDSQKSALFLHCLHAVTVLGH